MIVQEKETKKITAHLWDSQHAVVNIPSLCIHLDRDSNAKFEMNQENHLKLIMGTTVIDQLMGEGIAEDQEGDIFNVQKKNFKTFLDKMATDLGVSADEIVDFELACYDHHPPAITGLHQEFVSSPRLDNLASSLCSIDSLVQYHANENKDNNEISMIMLFDHEEVGSQSAQGADSNIIVEATERISFNLNPALPKEDYYRIIRNSFLISADMAHAIHPNYAEKHQAQHQPKMH